MIANGTLVKIKPLTKKMKDRVHQHGDTMRVVASHDKTVILIDGTTYNIMLESLNKTFKIGMNWFPWSGWIMADRDCVLTEVKND